MGILGTPLGYVMWAINAVVNNYGLSLVLFIILTKVLLFPITIKQQKTSAKTMSVQPKLKALQKKYGNNKEKYQEEMMKLYEEEGINPMGGCFPMIIQFLLLFGVIDVIYKPMQHLLHIPKDIIASATSFLGTVSSAVEVDIITAVQTGSKDFGGIFSAEMLDQIKNFNMNFLGFNMGDIPQKVMGMLIIIPILSGVTAFLSSWISMRQQSNMGQQVNGMLKGMMFFMPLMSVWIAFTLPAGVGLYWIISNVFSIVQIIIMNKVYSPDKMADMNDKNKEKNKEKLKKRREKMQKYNEVMAQKGLEPKYKSVPTVEEDENSPDALSKKEAEKRKIAIARKKLAEKYGDDFNAE
ncbi:MAG: YidC/Oxa1 family membrane protein insertase [Oscillospiraceae bacterium]